MTNPPAASTHPPDHPRSNSARSIAAIVVTRNRLALLKECLASLRSQTRPIDEIILINNDSNDGTREWLDEQSGVTVIHQGNLGGAGGFHRGLKEAYGHGHDWFWCMDDDTIPNPDALERLTVAPAYKDGSAGFLGSVVRWTDGALHKMNMVGQTSGDFSFYDTVLADKCVPCQVSTFVSILINREAVIRVGLPLKEFFIWSDDVEYTHRISRLFPCYHVLDSVAIHKTPANKDGDLRTIEPSDVFKLRYGLRNQVSFMRRQGGLSLRGVRVAYFITRTTLIILKSRAPLSLVRHLLSGLFFSPVAEMVTPQPALGEGEAQREKPVESQTEGEMVRESRRARQGSGEIAQKP